MARPKRRRDDYEEEEQEQEASDQPDDEVIEDSEEAAADDEQQDDDAEQESAAAAAAGGGGPRPEYPRGSVKKVRVCNFMTYGTPAVTITPGPRLNLVLGPNGTGKSSLVCALCLGLTGPPKLLGRADNLKDFIRRGADGGWVETTLSGGGGGRRDVVVRCEMAKAGDGYTTRWRINGATVNKGDVTKLVGGMNIQFDNLCQFLPQDKVVEFARLDPHELLVATEKAIGDASLAETHAALIARRDAMKLREKERDALSVQHGQLVADNAKLEREYARYEARQELRTRIKMVRDKLAWVGVYEAQAAARSADEAETAARAALDEASRAAKGDERPATQRRAAADDAKKRLTGLQGDMKRHEAAGGKAAERLAKEEESVRRLRGELEGLEAASRKAAADKAKLEARVDALRGQVDAAPPPPDHSHRIKEIADQQHTLNEQINAIEGDKMETLNNLAAARMELGRIESSLREVSTASWQRLQALMSAQPHHKGLDDMAAWVAHQRSAGAFAGQVVGPLGVEVKVRSPAHAQFLEMAVFSQLANFAVTAREDEKILTQELGRRGLWRVRVVSVPPASVAAAQQTGAVAASDELRAAGVLCSLDEVYDAPPLVRAALASTANLQQVFVLPGGWELSRVRGLMEAHGLKQVFTPEKQVNYIPSAYGGRGAASVVTRDLFPLKVLGGAGGDLEQAERRKAELTAAQGRATARITELSAAQAGYDSRKAPLEGRIGELQREREGLNSEVHKATAARTKLVQQLRQATNLLSSKEGQPDPLSKAPALQRQLAAALTKHHAALSEMLSAQESRWSLLQQATATELAMRELDMQAKALAAAIEEQRSTLTALKRAHEAAHAAARAAVAAYKAAERAAKEDHPLDKGARAAFAQLPDDRSELSCCLSELQGEHDAITVNNPRVAEEYRARRDAIESKARALAALAAALADDAATLDTLKSAWLPELQRVVGLINASFGANFSQIGCAGEVALGTHEDYDKFSIQIRVKFREHEELQLLTAHRQSGGERSVSTILYLIALQGVTVTPFRVVDEINQGMDPANERRVFEQLVTASCQAGTPQCFLLTPKLLPDLPFTEDITVLNIFNGGLVPEAVAGSYSFQALVGSSMMAQLAARRGGGGGGGGRGIPVAG